MYTSGTIANSQRMPTELNKNGAIAKVGILVEQVILEDIQKHLIFILSNEKPILLILCR